MRRITKLRLVSWAKFIVGIAAALSAHFTTKHLISEAYGEDVTATDATALAIFFGVVFGVLVALWSIREDDEISRLSLQGKK